MDNLLKKRQILDKIKEYDRIIDKMNGYCLQFGFALDENGRLVTLEE